MAATKIQYKYIIWLVIDLCILKVQKSSGDVFKLIESLLLLPVDFLIICLKWPPMKIHDLSNIDELENISIGFLDLQNVYFDTKFDCIGQSQAKLYILYCISVAAILKNN